MSIKAAISGASISMPGNFYTQPTSFPALLRLDNVTLGTNLPWPLDYGPHKYGADYFIILDKYPYENTGGTLGNDFKMRALKASATNRYSWALSGVSSEVTVELYAILRSKNVLTPELIYCPYVNSSGVLKVAKFDMSTETWTNGVNTGPAFMFGGNPASAGSPKLSSADYITAVEDVTNDQIVIFYTTQNSINNFGQPCGKARMVVYSISGDSFGSAVDIDVWQAATGSFNKPQRGVVASGMFDSGNVWVMLTDDNGGIQVRFIENATGTYTEKNTAFHFGASYGFGWAPGWPFRVSATKFGVPINYQGPHPSGEGQAAYRPGILHITENAPLQSTYLEMRDAAVMYDSNPTSNTYPNNVGGCIASQSEFAFWNPLQITLGNSWDSGMDGSVILKTCTKGSTFTAPSWLLSMGVIPAIITAKPIENDTLIGMIILVSNGVNIVYYTEVPATCSAPAPCPTPASLLKNVAYIG